MTDRTPPTVSAQEWEAARQTLLIEEKQLTRAHDALAAKRRRMPKTEGNPQTRAYAWWRRHDEYESNTDPWDGQLDEKIAANKEHARRTAGDAA